MKIVTVEVFDNTALADPDAKKVNLSVSLSDGDTLVGVAQRLMDAFGEDTKVGDPEEDPKPGRRRTAAKEEPEKEEEEDEPKKPGRRRRRTAAKEEPENEDGGEEEEPKKPRRRRRSTKEDDDEGDKGPTQQDVAKAASEGAEIVGPELMAEIIADFSDDGKTSGIPADKRQEFIDEVAKEVAVEQG